MSNWTVHRATVASLSRTREPNDPDLVAARRNLKAARLEDYVARVVTTAPQLTDEQKARIASLLGGASA